MRRRLGQHFLRNRAALKRIAAALAITSKDTVFEIGPGHGELTRELLSYSPRRLVVFERDPVLAADLPNLAPDIEVRLGDALEELPLAAADTGDFLLAGNIPYYISGHLFRILGELPHPPLRSVFTIQKEVADRIVSGPPHMNRLAASLQVWAEPQKLFNLPARDFSPPPEVDSASLLLTRRPAPLASNFDRVLTSVFAQPRKTVANNLRTYMHCPLVEMETRLAALDISPSLRPQDLSLAQLIRISSLLS